jgi:hypothetical protein
MKLFKHHIYARLLSLAVVVWATAVIPVFYAYHHFKTVPLAVGLLRLGGDLLTAAVLGIIATAWGRLVLRWARIRTQSHLEGLVFGAAVGYGLLATIMLVLGLAGWLRRPVIWGVTLALAAAGLPEIWHLVQEWQQTLRVLSWPAKIAWNFETFLWFCLGASLLLGVLLALLPPTSWDALIVHLVIPKEALAQGRLSPDLQKIGGFTGRPILQHMLFAWGMALRGDTVPKLIHLSLALCTVLTVYSMTRRYLRCSPLLAATLFFMTPVVQLVASWAYVDVGVTFYTVITLYALLNWLHGQETHWALLAALLAAWSAQVKNNGWFILVFSVGMVVYKVLRTGWPGRQRVRFLVLFGLVGTLASLPWLVSNYWLSQQLLPQARQVAYKVSPTASQTAVQFQGIVRIGTRYLTLPWWMTMKGVQGVYEFDGELGPLFLLFLPLWALIWREERAVRVLMLCVATEFLLWLAWSGGGRLQNRLLMPIFPLLAILTARALERLRGLTIPSFSLFHFMRLVIVGVLLISLLFQLTCTSIYNPGAFILGIKDRDEYLSCVLDHFYTSSPQYYSAMRHIEDSLSPSDRVGLLWPERRVYYVPHAYVADPLPLRSSPEEMWQTSQTLGLTHLLVHRSSLDFQLHRSGDPRLDREAIAAYIEHLGAFLKEHGRQLYDEHEEYELYALGGPRQ